MATSPARAATAGIASPNAMHLAAATVKRKNTETDVPISPPTRWNASKRLCSALAAKATPAEAIATTEAWPSEKKKPTPTGRWPSCISLRVTLSIAAIWSASTACRKPKL